MKRIATATLLALALFSSCKREGNAPLASAHAYDAVPVILISIDTLRADHLSLYGSKVVRTPSFEALAKDSVVFEHGYSHCPLTVPSHLSVLTGTLPQVNGVRDNIGFHFDPVAFPPLASRLKQKGYATGAAISAYVLRRQSGVSAGFDDYDDSIPVIPGAALSNLSRRGSETISVAKNWLAQHKEQKFFYFLHLYEPHAPYEPPDEFKSLYSDPYDGEVAYSDSLLGEFIGWLKQSGIYDRALVIVFSDHGEGLMEHGEQEHGILLYNGTLHVPLLVKLPRSESGGHRVSTAVELRQICSTVLQATGAPLEAQASPSLISTAAQPNNADRAVFSETMYPRIHLGWSDLRALSTATHQFVDAPTPLLFDLQNDPGEKHNVLSDQRRVYVRLRQEIQQYVRQFALPQNVDPEEAAKLAALGYISATRPTAATNLPDPNDHIVEIEKVKQAFKLAHDRNYQLAIIELKKLVEVNPTWTDSWTKLAYCYEAQGDYASAIATYRRAIQVAPTLASEYALSLASMLLKVGQFDDAAKHAELALKDNPGGTHQVLGEIALARNDLQTAAREAALTVENAQYRLQGLLLTAQIDSAAGRLPEALTMLDHLEGEARATHRLPFAYLEFVRGDALARLNRNAEAETAFGKEIEAFPQDRQAFANLALLQLIGGRTDAAYATLESMARANPDRHTLLFAAKTLDTLGDKRGAALWRQRAESVR